MIGEDYEILYTNLIKTLNYLSIGEFDEVGPALVKGFAVVIMGGMGNVQGILFSGLILGVAESLSASFISLGLSDAIAFAILIIILLFKPAGLFGKRI